MGRAKQMQLEQQAELDHVLGMLTEEGAISECEIHEGNFVDDYDEEAAARVKAELQNAYGHTADEADSLVQSALEHAGDECGYCAKNRDD